MPRPFPARLAALACAAMLWSVPAQAEGVFRLSLTSYHQAVAEQVGTLPGADAFYRARGFAPLWTGPEPVHAARREALIGALARAADHGLPAARYDVAGLMARLGAARTGRDRGEAEIALTRAFLQYAHDVQSGLLEPSDIVSHIKRERPRRDPATLLSAFENADPRAALRALAPQSTEYARLLRAKMTLERAIALDAWGAPVGGGTLEPGDSGARVVALRDRLVAMDYLAPHLGAAYDDTIAEAVRAFQADHGLEPDGVAGADTLRAIAVPPEERLKSVLVAMERERWLNLEGGRGERHVFVNLVDFHARIMDDGKETFRTRSVIGHQDRDRQTYEFSDVMEYMEINPYWYVPRSIIRGEYGGRVPRGFQATDARGRVVNTGSVMREDGQIVYNLRQPPGPNNALGTVKFMFPNKHAIYLHDTPARSLFSRSVRTFSHGCIRLQDPHDFAYALLARQEADPVDFFQTILQSGQNTRVDLEQPIPVHLDYRTAYTVPKGRMQYRPDVYGRDAAIWAALAREGVALAAAQG